MERGEAGVAPVLRGDFYKLINVAVYEGGSLPKLCTAPCFSTTWSSAHDLAWRRLMRCARARYNNASLVDFAWGRAGEPPWLEGGPVPNVGRIVIASLPVDFVQVSESRICTVASSSGRC